MYVYDRDSKCIVTPLGEHIKGKQVTEELNKLYYYTNKLAETFQVLEILTRNLENAIYEEGDEDGQLDGAQDEDSGDGRNMGETDS